MKRRVVVHDQMQHGYVYDRTEPERLDPPVGSAWLVSVVLPVLHAILIAIQPRFASGDLLVTKNRVSAFAGRGLELLLGSFLD